MYAFFFSRRDETVQVAIPHGKTVTGKRYRRFRAVAAWKSSSADGKRGGREREGDSRQGGGGAWGIPRENYEFLALLCAF